MSQAPEDVYRVARDYFAAWRNGDWNRLRGFLAPEVVLESPRLGRVVGIDAHLRLYREERRFPGIRGLQPGPIVHGPDMAVVIYDVYLGAEQKRATVFDRIYVRDRLIVHVLSVMEEWPD
jgi:hypothetical protein